MKLSIGDLFDGRFRIDGEAGGIYSAQDQYFGERVGLELIGERTAADPTTAGAFTQQARAAKDVAHAGLIPVLDAGVSTGTPWIATELRTGETLRVRMDRGPLPEREAIEIGIAVLEALGVAHGQGLVHRALSPSDIVLGSDGKASIRGFGKGALTPSEVASLHVSPEQASGGEEVGPTADVYSVCAIVYEAISGKLPYDVSSFGELVKVMYTEGPKPLLERSPNVSPELASVIDRGLAVQPDQRPADTGEVVVGLRGHAETAQLPATAMPKTMALDSNALMAAVSAPGTFSAAAGAPNIAQPAQVIPAQPQKASGGSGGTIAFGLVAGGCLLVLGLIFIGGLGAGMYYALGAEEPHEPYEAYEPYAPDVALSNLSPMAGVGEERIRIDASAAPAIGGAQPLVTIVTFSEFQCPFCSRVEPTMDRIRATYGDRVRIVWRHNPLAFHQNALPAAQAAHEAYVQGGDDRFWAMHDQLFANQQQLDRASLERYGAAAGMDVTQLRAALDSDRHLSRVQSDQAIATRADARGTPAFFVNGRKLMGAQPYERFSEIIDEEIAIANELMLRGVSRGSLYETFQRDATLTPGPVAPDPAPTPARREPDPNAIYRVPIGNSPARGPATALVTVVVFSEFQCPFCSRVEPTIDQIVERYGSEVRVVWKNNPLPFHQNALPAAELAMEAHAQGRFWPMHDVLFENQRELGRGDLERYAQQQGLSAASARRALDQHPHRAAIEADQALARSLGASGTPAFFINGRNLRGAQPLAVFQRVIDEEMARARVLLNAGTPRLAIYEASIRNGHTTAQFVGAAPAPDPTAAQRPDADARYNVPVPARVPARGPTNAPLTIQIFSDFQCPFCSRVNPTVDQIVERYGNRVRVVWRHYPLAFHDNAMPAAQASVEVWEQGGDVAFWAYHELLFENQRSLSSERLVSLAGRVRGIDANRVGAALRDGRHRARVQSDMDAVSAAGMRIGTPSFLIGDRLLQGAQPFSAFQAQIDAALGE